MTSAHPANLPQPGAYAAAWKLVKAAAPEQRFQLDWALGLQSRDETLSEFRRALDRRINARAGDHEANRPLDAGWIRDCRALQDIRQRVRVYQFERPEVRALFGHLLSSRFDD